METYRINDDAHVYYVTYSIVEWLPVFVSETACKIITDSLTYCHHNKHLRTNAFVVMPTHIHAIVFDREFSNKRLQQTLNDLRKFTGRSICDYCETKMPKCFMETMHAAAIGDRR